MVDLADFVGESMEMKQKSFCDDDTWCARTTLLPLLSLKLSNSQKRTIIIKVLYRRFCNNYLYRFCKGDKLLTLSQLVTSCFLHSPLFLFLSLSLSLSLSLKISNSRTGSIIIKGLYWRFGINYFYRFCMGDKLLTLSQLVTSLSLSTLLSLLPLSLSLSLSLSFSQTHKFSNWNCNY